MFDKNIEKEYIRIERQRKLSFKSLKKQQRQLIEEQDETLKKLLFKNYTIKNSLKLKNKNSF